MEYNKKPQWKKYFYLVPGRPLIVMIESHISVLPTDTVYLKCILGMSFSLSLVNIKEILTISGNKIECKHL